MRRLVALALCSGCSLIVDPPHERHPEVTVNSIAAQKQSRASVVFAQDDYVIVWQDDSLTPPDTSDTAIRGRLVALDGTPEATDFLINDPATSRGAQEHPSAAAIGPVVLVVWTDGSGPIKGRMIAASGSFVTPELVISTASGLHDHPCAIALASGAFLVAWDDSGGAIRARRIAGDGTPLDASEVVINTTLSGNQEPVMARGADDRILIAWENLGTASDIRARLLAPDARPLGTDFVINSSSTGAHENPSVTAMRAGGYFAAWTDGSAAGADTTGTAIGARIFDANATGTGDDFVLNTRTPGDQSHPRGLLLTDGTLFVAYEDASMLPPDTDGSGVRARRFDAYGTPHGDDVQVNTYFTGNQERAAMATDAGGSMLAVWQDESNEPGTGNADVRARLYAPN